MVDFITVVRSRLIKKYRLHTRPPTSEDFSILIPIFGNMSYLRNVDFLSEYGSKVILCTTTHESEQFNADIERIADARGFRIYRSKVVTDVKNKEELIRDGFEIVESKYCVFLDGDTVSKDSLNKLVGQFEKKKYDVASVRILSAKNSTLMEKMQNIEYELAMDARKVYPWLTSGACIVAKTRVIREVMSHHSLFFSGGDIEIGKLASMLGYSVGHIPAVFYTDVPPTFKVWFRQRMAWFAGGFRHAIVNGHTYTWRHPLLFFYNTVLVYALMFLRWYEVIAHPLMLGLLYIFYLIIIALAHGRAFKSYYLLFPLYALVQVLVIAPLGVYTYLKMAIRADNPGIIKLRSKMKETTIKNFESVTGERAYT